MATDQQSVEVVSQEAPFLAPGQQPDGTIPQKPADLPEQFWDAEKGQVRVDDLAKSYAELAAKSKPAEEAPVEGGAPADAEDPTKPKEGEVEEKKPDETTEAQDLVSKAGLDLGTLGEAFSKDGKLSDDDYTKLAALGITRDLADSYGRGQMALAQAAERALHEAAGGSDKASELLAWASTNLPAERVTELNKGFESGDLNAAVLSMQAVRSEYEKANGRPPEAKLGGQAPSGPTGYSDWAEVMADMNKPEYRTSEAFRQRVQAKLKVSKV